MDITQTTSLLSSLPGSSGTTQNANTINGFNLPVESGDEVEISSEAGRLSEAVTEQLNAALPSLLNAQTSTSLLGTLSGGDANASLIEAATFADANGAIQAANLSGTSSLLNLLG